MPPTLLGIVEGFIEMEETDIALHSQEVPVSVVVPVLNGQSQIVGLLDSISGQQRKPKEIIVIDSSTHNEVQELVANYPGHIPIHYFRVKKSYPGSARNIGATHCRYDWIAFLDCGTQPEPEWLSTYLDLAESSRAKIVYGQTRAVANNTFQKYLKTATYGDALHRTLPGTLIDRNVFETTGGFINDLRMAEDIEWMQRVEERKIASIDPGNHYINYYGLPKILTSAIAKFMLSGYHASRVLHGLTNAYVSAVLVGLLLVVPKWNYFIYGWDSNPLFIPHITKVIFLISTLGILIYIWINQFISTKTKGAMVPNISLISLIIIGGVGIWNWNQAIADWVEDSIWFVPHITKIYVSTLAAGSLIYRGIYRPLTNGGPYAYLFPFRWILVGLLGLVLDCAKAPGYLLGAAVRMFHKTH